MRGGSANTTSIRWQHFSARVDGMRVDDLALRRANENIQIDVLIVGAGPAGLTIARELARGSYSVLIMESGVFGQDERYAELDRIESVGEPLLAAQIVRRVAQHSALTKHWRHERQPYGLRVRAFGGAAEEWAGKSAAFDPIDYETRPWVANSGWPVSHNDIAPFLDRAGAWMNLGPNIYGSDLLAHVGRPEFPNFAHFKSFFWQYARGFDNPLEPIRFSREFLKLQADNITILTNATATAIRLSRSGRGVEAVEASAYEGQSVCIQARYIVLACGAIETPRLMLASRDVNSNGVGNDHDVVGRYMVDHPGVRLARFDAKQAAVMDRVFGFVSVSHKGAVHPYSHGLTLSPAVQERFGLVNCALFMMGERTRDNPWDAIKRLAQHKSAAPARDVWRALSNAGLVCKGLAIKAVQHPKAASIAKAAIVEIARALDRTYCPHQYKTGGLPHKLDHMFVDVLLEQTPDPDSRIQLAARTDRFGTPLAQSDWRICNASRRTLAHLSEAMQADFRAAGLPTPELVDWAAQGHWDNAVMIDVGHTMGTTRMANDPKRGVVDVNCKVHGIDNLFISGGGVFPTGSHVNPTLMIVAFATRLADHLKSLLTQSQAVSVSSMQDA